LTAAAPISLFAPHRPASATNARDRIASGCAALARLAYSAAMATPALAAAGRDEPGDEDLMQAYAAGDAAAFDTLYARHKGGVYRYIVRQCGNAGTADELFQDVWMSVIRVRTSYAPTAKFTTWLYRIAHNRLIDHWRATGHVELVAAGTDDDDDDPLDAIPGARSDEPDVRAGVREIGARLKQALSALPAAQREAFLLHQEGGLELAEISALTGVGVETVKSRIRYALAKLRAELGDLK
jgi:RNA polymerase sigma-70 factor (ECF subfamily)